VHIVITGANGFVGQALSARLQRDTRLGGRPISALTLLDTGFAGSAPAAFVQQQAGSIADAGVVKAAFERPVDVVVHLASIPGGTAEQQYELGRDVNLQGTTFLLEQAKAWPRCLSSRAPSPCSARRCRRWSTTTRHCSRR
jgi:D-erythronate 2-dehydrogenase